MLVSLLTNVLKLAISIRVLLSSQLLLVGSQAVVVLFEQATDDWQTYPVLVIEALLNISQTTVEPLSFAHWITCCVGLHDVQQYCL